MASTTAPTTRNRRRLGALLMIASLTFGALVTVFAPVAAAQEAEEPEQAPEDRQEAKVTKSGFWDAPLNRVIPPSVMQQFPPQVVCLVVVKACTGKFHQDQPEQIGEGFNQVTGGVEEGLTAVKENDPGEPESPVPPDTLPVSVTTGQARYRSALQFELPPVPTGHEVDDFKIYLVETDPTGGVSSPVARQAILAALTCAREGDGPGGRCDTAQFEKILMMGCDGTPQDEPGTCPAEQEPLSIEMCPIVDDPATPDANEAEWKGERSQDPQNLPATDCFLGANGKRLAGGIWEFDLTFALEEWATGAIPNNGVLIRPQKAPNFAFGDPDSTFNKQVTFEQAVTFTVASSEAPEPIDFGSGSSGGDFGSGTTSSGNSGGFAAPSGGSGGGNVSTFSSPAQGDPDAAPAPEVAGGASAPAGQQSQVPVAAGPQQPAASNSAWYAWLAIPLFLAGGWLVAQSLTGAGAPAVAAASRDGAMSRILKQRSTSAGGQQLA